MIVLEFVYERSTKNTHRFQEVAKPGKQTAVGTLYITKAVLPEANNKTTIKVTLSPSTDKDQKA